MKALQIALAAVAATVALLALPFLLPAGRPSAVDPGLPWEVQVPGDGSSRVFGLTLGTSTLADARVRLGADLQLAIVVAPGEAPSLEAFHDQVTAGFVAGRMVVTADVPAARLEALLGRAKKAEYMESTTRRVTLADEDVAQAMEAPIAAIAFVPSVQLDEQMVLQRFGVPAQRVRTSPTVEHFLYPDRGLDVVLDGKAREVLQYVAPRHFERLRAPLVRPPS